MTDQRKVENPRLAFLGPGMPLEIPVPVVVPLSPAPERPTIKRPIKPGRSRDRSREFRRLQAQARKAKLASAEADRLKRLRAAKFLRGAPWATGFQIGWELGDYLFPNGFYSFGSSDPNAVDYAIPAGWSITCDTGGPRDYWRYEVDVGGTSPGGETWSTGLPTCGIGLTNLELARKTMSPVAGISFRAAEFVRVNPLDADTAQVRTVTTWVHDTATSIADVELPTLIPGVGTPVPLVRSLPSEAPQTFPLEQVMEMPFPQTWADAVPLPKSQGEGKYRRGRAEVTVPRLPLTPFAIVEVVPPGATVPPPPDQVIDIPPPAPPGQGGGTTPPPTYHQRPPQGRKPPGKKTHEKKLSVRSVANKSWIVLNLATEGFDFIDALFEALPISIKKATRASIDYGEAGGGNADPYSKAKAIYDNFDMIDWDKFVNNFINMQLTDMAVGMIGMTSQRFLKMTGQSTGSGGLASKPTSTADKALDDYLAAKIEDGEMTKEEAKAIKEQAKLPIPQVSFNEQSGQWEVSVEPWGLTFY